MAKPVLSAVSVFDATLGTTAYFKIYVSYTNPSVVQEYEYTVYDGSEDEVIYTSSGTAQNLSYSVRDGWGFQISPNEKFKNRSSNYYLKIRIRLESEESYGEYSSPVALYSKERPILSFSGLSKDTENIIQMSATVFELQYTANEEQGETLKTYKYAFYGSEKNLIDESQSYYGSVTHSFSMYSLESGKSYFVRGTAVTKNGYELDTGFYPIKISYSVSNSSYAFEAENNRFDASIRLTSHFISSTGLPSGDFSYVKISDNNYVVDLTNGTKVTYFVKDPSGLKDFDLKLFVKANVPSEIAEIYWKNDNYLIVGSISLHSRAFTEDNDPGVKTWAKLTVKVEDNVYLTIESNFIVYSNKNNYLLVDLSASDGFFNLYLKEIGNVSMNGFAVLGKSTRGHCVLGSDNTVSLNSLK